MTAPSDTDRDASDPPEPAENGASGALTLAEALDLATRLHQSSQFDVAEAIYQRILDVVPDHAAALHYLGILCHQTGRSDRALALIHAAIALDPADAAMHSNLGNVLAERDRPDEAAAAYRAALALNPDNADALNNFGATLRILGDVIGAEDCYRRAIAVKPDHQAAYDNLGRLLSSAGRIKEAILCHAKALDLEPRNPQTRRLLVAAFAAGGEPARALEILDGWLRDAPDDAIALHLRAAISGENVPARASDPFIETTFDRFAPSFDAKLARLDYRAPQLVALAVKAACATLDRRIDVLDAGCGTGLCAPFLRGAGNDAAGERSLLPFGARLVGVDLSAQMLRQAQERGLYDNLVKAELTAFMLDNRSNFDLIVSADTLCYFGALQEVLSAAAIALRPGGALVFSVEHETQGPDVRLHPHGRYSHSEAHVIEALAASGLRPGAITHDALRREKGEDVPGLIVTARRTPPLN